MQVTVNGEARDFPDGATISELLAALGLAGLRVAVEVNRKVIPRARHDETRVAPGDKVEVVQFVGGG